MGRWNVTDYLFIAEKPSLAEAVAKARAVQMGVTASKGGGYWTVGNDKVCWLFGHMYENFKPQEYDVRWGKFRFDVLPIIPEKWRLKPVTGKEKHIAGIVALLKDAKNVVNVGDAAREGQLLVDELLIENAWDPFADNTQRLWVSSVAQKDLLKALDNMAGNKTKQNLYFAAVCRQRADWLHGMNMTVAYTVKARESGADQLVTVGRVQTPTLRLVVDRDLEIKNFKAVDHYLPAGQFVHENGKFTATYIIPDDCPGLDSEGRLTDKAAAQEITDRISGKTGMIDSYAASDKSKVPPLPHSLSALQTECSSKFSLTAKQTLDVAQKLYDAGITTYPRSDSRYLPMAILKDEAPGILEALKGVDGALGEAAKGSNGNIKTAAWNDAKVSDHHGIIPTAEATPSKIAGLSGVDAKVFELIAKTFIAQFYPDQRWKSISAQLSVGDDKFKASGRREIDAGWRRVFTGDPAGDESEDTDEEAAGGLPEMKKADPVSVEGGELQSKRTTPPAAFTDGTLIQAMSEIHKFVTDPETKKRLKEGDGLGTEATRAPTLENLLDRKYMERKGKKLLSTATGQSIIGALPPEITDPGLTAIWEGYLAKVEKGDLDHEAFMEVQVKNIRNRVESAKTAQVSIRGGKTIAPLEGHGETCSKCKEGQMITRELRKGQFKGKKLLSCNRFPDCDNAVWPGPTPIKGHGEACTVCNSGKLITREVRKEGPNKGKKFLGCDNRECKNMKWPDPDIKPADGHGKKCPKCEKGALKTRKSPTKGTIFLGCDAYPTCKHVEFPPDKKIPPIAGHGDGCSKCSKGKMVTREVRKEGPNKGKKFLGCDNRECDQTVWPK
jgi:DNA topoisomerase III